LYYFFILPMIFSVKMPNAKSAKKKMGRPKLNKRTVSIRLSPEMIKLAKFAALSADSNLSNYIELALRNQIAKDDIR
jgi:hypothetical protein